MDNEKKYRITLFGEFYEKPLEAEFLNHAISGYTKTISFVALVFGVLCMLFLGNDVSNQRYTNSILIIAITRVLFLVLSIIIFFGAKHFIKSSRWFYLSIAYETITAVSYLVILDQYESISYLSVLGLMVVSLAMYLVPNRIVYSLIISSVFSLLFFLFQAQKLDGIKDNDIYKVASYQIILLIYCNINAYMANLYRRRQFAANREIYVLSIIDPLTGIFNRAKFNKEIDALLKLPLRDGNHISLIFFDIDDFKKINDNHGHLVGDRVIKGIVETVKESVRETDVFARWGGEEFVILLPNTDIRLAGKIAEGLRLAIRNKSCEQVKNVSCSFGISTLEEGDTAQSFLRKADNQLIQAKKSGKDRVAFQA
jgi:diguanylate cyclase (GGDEF)-like protein